MSATDKLDYLKETKEMIRGAINTFGIEVSENDTFRSYADKIVQIKTNGGLEIGDIGIAPFGIDEEQDFRRYLNGQIILQDKFKDFSSKIKGAIKLNPNIATTEENWQAEVTNSINGTCGKFVIDDDRGTIRLPKYPDYVSKEYVETAVIGNGLALGLKSGTNTGSLTGGSYTDKALWASSATGEIGEAGSSTNIANTSKLVGVTTDPSLSGIIADFENATTETIPCKWFIQVATGTETTVDVTRQIQLVNPFSLLDYKWSEYEITNTSWLISNGAFHSGAIYTAVYELLLKLYNGEETKEGVNVKLITEEYTDYDFVLNTDDTSFRLPIKVKLASGNAVAGNGMTLGLYNNNGTYSLGANTNISAVAYDDEAYGVEVGTAISNSGAGVAGGAYGVTTDPTKSGIETSSDGLKLYFYVGETIQDANIINASQVLTTVADCVRKSSESDKEMIMSWGFPDYSTAIALTSSDKSFTATYRCWLLGYSLASAGTNQIVYVNNVAIGREAGDYISIQMPLDIGDVVTVSAGDLEGLTVCAMKGVKL